MSKSMNRMMWSAAAVAGLGALGAAGMMTMQSAKPKGGGMSGRGMMNRVTDMGEEFADEFCVMAHKTGNAMIRAGRLINRLVP